MAITAVVLVLLAAGGYFAWTQFLSGNSGEGSSEFFAKSTEPGFVEMEPVTAPWVRDGKFAHYVVLVVNLELTSEDDIGVVRKYMPRLRDAFVTELHAIAMMRPRRQRLIKIERVKARLLVRAERVLGPGVVSGVLVQLAQ